MGVHDGVARTAVTPLLQRGKFAASDPSDQVVASIDHCSVMANAILEDAKTGRSKCATTGAEIAQGSPRVGFEIWRMGRRCMTFQTPRAFLAGLRLHVAENGR